MAVYRVDVLTNDPYAFRQWVLDNIPSQSLVRFIGYRVPDGWYFKNVFSQQDVAERFHRHWYPDAEDHNVREFGNSQA